MSYDLYFYKKKEADLPDHQIAKYLTDHLGLSAENNHQWFYENQDTSVYYFFNYEPESDPEDNEFYDCFEDFDNTCFSFNLNFMRPVFFGLEAFQFIEQFISDLNLFVLNPQSEFENPYSPAKDDLFKNWNKTNLWASSEHFKQVESSYMPSDKCNEVWHYNFNRSRLQKELGDGYFVPKIIFLKAKQSNEVITMAVWPEHIPIVIPEADYFVLTRRYKKLFRSVEDKILISREKLLNTFGDYLDEFWFKNCKIIHPVNAEKIGNKFNSLRSEYDLAVYAEGLSMENLHNAKPGE